MYEPPGQEVHSRVVAESRYWPREQKKRHDSMELAPVNSKKVPAGHDVHALDPCWDAYVFGKHPAHVVSLVAPVCCEYFPTAHGWHSACSALPRTVP